MYSTVHTVFSGFYENSFFTLNRCFTDVHCPVTGFSQALCSSGITDTSFYLFVRFHRFPL